jgi:hypothetical protein
MSSDRPRCLLSALTFADGPGRCRLHSRGFALFTRMGALLLVLSLFPWLRSESIAEATIHVALVLVLAWLLWSRPKRVFATTSGLIVGAGKSFRHIPWSRVLDVRELPWLRFSPPWYPKLWQVDLEPDECFDFCGVRNAREIVVEFVKRSEARQLRA